ncbi:CD1375 family protein [Streptococcus sp. P25B114]
MMVMLMAMNIVDEHFDFAFKDVPRIFKKKVKAQLELMGHPELADESVANYIPKGE